MEGRKEGKFSQSFQLEANGCLGNAKAGDCEGHSSCWVKVASWG